MTIGLPARIMFFIQKGHTGRNETMNSIKRDLARVRATTMAGLFGPQKEHYGL